MSKPQVFINYAHDDADEARRFCKDLKALGVNTWMDEDNMHPGKWKKQITKAITSQRFTSMDKMQDAIETVMLIAPGAKVIHGD